MTFYTLYRDHLRIEVFPTRCDTRALYLIELRMWNTNEPGKYLTVDRRCVKRVLGIPLSSTTWPLPWPKGV